MQQSPTGHIPGENHTSKKTHIPLHALFKMSTAALFKIARAWKQPNVYQENNV